MGQSSASSAQPYVQRLIAEMTNRNGVSVIILIMLIIAYLITEIAEILDH